MEGTPKPRENRRASAVPSASWNPVTKARRDRADGYVPPLEGETVDELIGSEQPRQRPPSLLKRHREALTFAAIAGLALAVVVAVTLATTDGPAVTAAAAADYEAQTRTYYIGADSVTGTTPRTAGTTSPASRGTTSPARSPSPGRTGSAPPT
jgi:hypothetical protein